MDRQRQSLFIYLTVFSTLIISACQYLPAHKRPAEQQVQASASPAEPETMAKLHNSDEVKMLRSAEPISRGQQQILELGTGEFIAQPQPESSQIQESGEGDITLNFQNTDLREFVKAILGDVLQKNYVIDPKVSGKVTIETASPVNKNELFPLFENILAMNDTAVIEVDGVYQVIPRKQASTGNLSPTVVQKNTTNGYSVRIIPLRFIAAQEMQKILEPLVSEGSGLRIDKKRNLIIASGTTKEINNIQETIDIFDVDWLRGMSVGLYPLDYVDPKTLKTELDSIIGAMEGEENKELLGGLVRTVPIERLNSILLISSTAAALREVELWLYRLDRPGDHAGKRLYVYNVQNAKATELADILGHIFKSTVSASSSKETTPQLAPGLTPVEIASPSPNAEQKQQNTPEPPARTATDTTKSGLALLENSSIEIIADDVRNALVVLASPQEYKMVEAAILKLDIVPLQVLIEASIIEITLRDDLNYGVEWFFKNTIDANSGKGGRGTLDLGEAGLSALTGFSYTVVDSAEQVRVALNALAQESEVNVLSSPSLMVLDNKTAMINVGDEIPVPTRQSVSTLDPNAPTVNEIQFRQTGVTLTVTPRVNSGGLVTMEIKQEVSNAVSTTSSDIDAPTIQQRQVESVVAINSGETIVLGGLIQDTKTNGESGIPGLRKIPLIGNLFKQTRDEKRRTELLVLITPRVVGNRDEARDITDEFRNKLKSLKPFEESEENPS